MKINSKNVYEALKEVEDMYYSQDTMHIKHQSESLVTYRDVEDYVCELKFSNNQMIFDGIIYKTLESFLDLVVGGEKEDADEIIQRISN